MLDSKSKSKKYIQVTPALFVAIVQSRSAFNSIQYPVERPKYKHKYLSIRLSI